MHYELLFRIEWFATIIANSKSPRWSNSIQWIVIKKNATNSFVQFSHNRKSCIFHEPYSLRLIDAHYKSARPCWLMLEMWKWQYLCVLHIAHCIFEFEYRVVPRPRLDGTWLIVFDALFLPLLCCWCYLVNRTRALPINHSMPQSNHIPFINELKNKLHRNNINILTTIGSTISRDVYFSCMINCF